MPHPRGEKKAKTLPSSKKPYSVQGGCLRKCEVTLPDLRKKKKEQTLKRRRGKVKEQIGGEPQPSLTIKRSQNHSLEKKKTTSRRCGLLLRGGPDKP